MCDKFYHFFLVSSNTIHFKLFFNSFSHLSFSYSLLHLLVSCFFNSDCFFLLLNNNISPYVCWLLYNNPNGTDEYMLLFASHFLYPIYSFNLFYSILDFIFHQLLLNRLYRSTALAGSFHFCFIDYAFHCTQKASKTYITRKPVDEIFNWNLIDNIRFFFRL